MFKLACMLVTIETVKMEELSLLGKVSRKTFYDTFHQQNSSENMGLFLDENFTDDRLRSEMSNSLNYFFFARAEDEIVGYLKLSIEISEFDEKDGLEISRIYIVKEKLGKGVGKKLMQFAMSFAQQ